MYGGYFILAEWFDQQIHDARRGGVTYDRKWLAERKNEPSNAYYGDVCCQEGDGCEEVKERGVRPEALQKNVQSPARGA